MLNEIKIYLLIMSILFIIKYLYIIVTKILEDEPTPLDLTIKEEIFILISLSYIITSIII